MLGWAELSSVADLPVFRDSVLPTAGKDSMGLLCYIVGVRLGVSCTGGTVTLRDREALLRVLL